MKKPVFLLEVVITKCLGEVFDFVCLNDGFLKDLNQLTLVTSQFL